MNNTLATGRMLSIDVFRGITILVMIFVNELAGVKNIPAWMKHMPANADAMTFVDVVFPAFLFIVGMSIPFAINIRYAKGESAVVVQKHVLIRTLGLLILGVFMVNAEGGYNESAMGMSIYLWSLLFYGCVILVWNVYTLRNKIIPTLLRMTGVLGLLILALIYRAGEDGSEYMSPKWWGILGLIGWSYLVSSLLYQVLKARLVPLLTAFILCIVYYIVSQNTWIQHSAFSPLFSQAGHASHIAISLSGVILTLIFFDHRIEKGMNRRFAEALALTLAFIVTGYFLRPYFHISKIYATPTWSLYSAAICCILYSFLFWLVDLKKINSWTTFFKPAASNPLLTYIIPFIIYDLMHLLHLKLPGIFYQGTAGMIWSAFYSIAVMALVIVLNRLSIKLQL